MSIARETLTNHPAPADLPAHPVATWANEDGSGTIDCPCGYRHETRHGTAPMLAAGVRSHHRRLRQDAALAALLVACEGYGDVWIMDAVKAALVERAATAAAARLAEIENKRLEHLNLYGDAVLQAKVDAWDHSGPDGYARAAEALLTVTEAPEGVDLRQFRANIDTEAHIATNVSGGVYSRNVESQVHWALNTLAAGAAPEFPYTEANYAMLAREKAAKAATGVHHTESIQTAFAGLPIGGQR